MGDEVRRTQAGNNNAYGLDDETSWFDWALVAKHADVHRFVALLAEQRLQRGEGSEGERLSLNQVLRQANWVWHGVELGRPDWDRTSHSLAFTAEDTNHDLRFHVILNAYWEPLAFALPPAGDGDSAWRRWIDTRLDSPHDIEEWSAAPTAADPTYSAGARSVVVLFARRKVSP
jgi:isoamylase